MNINLTIKLKIKSIYRDLSVKETAMADFILSDPQKVGRMTISEISSALGFADSTLFQFAQKLGYKGYKDFRNDLLSEKTEPEISFHEDIKEGDDNLTITKKVFASSISSLYNTLDLLKIEEINEASGIIQRSNIVSFFGIGGSNVVAFDAYHKFLRSPIQVQYGTDSHIQLMQAGFLSEDDCAIITSHTGRTNEILQIAKVAKESGAKIIAITSFPLTPLVKLADVVLISAAEEIGYRSESLAARISQLAIIDSLFTLTMSKYKSISEGMLERLDSVIDPTKKRQKYPGFHKSSRIKRIKKGISAIYTAEIPFLRPILLTFSYYPGTSPFLFRNHSCIPPLLLH